MHTPLRIAIVGAGLVATRHLDALTALPEAKLAGIFSRTPDRTLRLAKRYEVPAFPTLAAILEDPGIDAVLVLTHTTAHFDIAAACLDAGKHVLVEKPVAESAEAIQALRTLARDRQRLCMPSHNYIYAPAARRLHAHFRAGRLGRLTSLWILYNQRHPANMGTPDLTMRELMVHHAYTALRFAGRPATIQALASNLHFEDPQAHDQIMLSAQTDAGAIINLWGSFAADDRCRDPWTMTIKLFGSDGSGTVSWDEIRFGDEPQPGWDDAAYWDSFYYVQQHFIAACQAGGAPPLSGLDDALDAHDLLQAARRALETGRRVAITYSN